MVVEESEYAITGRVYTARIKQQKVPTLKGWEQGKSRLNSNKVVTNQQREREMAQKQIEVSINKMLSS